MYVIPNDLEVNYAFPEVKLLGINFQIFMQDLIYLVGLPLLIPYGLSNEAINLIPNIPLFLGVVWGIMMIFAIYLTVFPSPTPLTRNGQRWLIWLNRPKGTFHAPHQLDLTQLILEDKGDVVCEAAPKSLKWYHKLHHKFLGLKQAT